MNAARLFHMHVSKCSLMSSDGDYPLRIMQKGTHVLVVFLSAVALLGKPAPFMTYLLAMRIVQCGRLKTHAEPPLTSTQDSSFDILG
jgi:hypothetical protein